MVGKVKVENNLRKFFEKRSGISSDRISANEDAEKLAGTTGAAMAQVEGDKIVVKKSSYANRGEDLENKGDTLREYVNAPLFTRVLYSQTPTISKIRSDSIDGTENKQRIASSFIEGSRPLSDYVDKPQIKIVTSLDDPSIKPHEMAIAKIDGKLVWKIGNPAGRGEISDPKLIKQWENYDQSKDNKARSGTILKDLRDDLLKNRDVKQYYQNACKQFSGFEKIAVSCLGLGDGDFHAGNILYKDGELFKIDHGKAGLVFIDTENGLRENLYERFSAYGYKDRMPLNAEKMQDAIASFSTITREEFETMVHGKIYSLSQEGFHFPRETSYFPTAHDKDVKRKTLGHNFITDPAKQDDLKPGDIALSLGQGDKIICKIPGKEPFEVGSIGPDHDYVKMLKEGKYSELAKRLQNEAEVSVEYEVAQASLRSLRSNNKASANEIAKMEEKVEAIRAEGVNEILEFTAKNRDVTGQHYTKSENQQRAQDIGDFYVEKYIGQQRALNDMSQTLDIIAKINPKNVGIDQKEWLNGRWLSEVKDRDPIVWAYRNNCQIEGMDPVLWAKENNKQIEGIDSGEWLEKNQHKYEAIRNAAAQDKMKSLSNVSKKSKLSDPGTDKADSFSSFDGDLGSTSFSSSSKEQSKSTESFVSYEGDLGGASSGSGPKKTNKKESFVSYGGDLGSISSIRTSLEERSVMPSMSDSFSMSKKNTNRGRM